MKLILLTAVLAVLASGCYAVAAGPDNKSYPPEPEQ
uniref:Acp5a n=1 Tax=Drosophila arizonae TaxID=7263 RepID=Q2VKR0_DROAR|nr:Acp5a [Drosophila arizonae]AAZ42595.1 Acp5a [Drosophila arizonae]AAZ42597.1 Acp5a [Drosophila arizonae]AAZ42600.1 Acp5a [Drosophila arizonae]